ncbi:hypothetical protein PENTCL1PPCAC_7986, partial [Pristionchus entomophagus]
CVSIATTFLNDLRLIPWPKDDYRRLILQCSDRHLEECTMYSVEAGLDEERLLELDGSSVEYTAPSYTANEFRQLSKTTALLDTVVVESAAKQCPLYLFSRRCYDRLTRDLFDSGLLICRDYEDAEKQMHENDTIQLPLILETTRRSSLERRLKAESSLMEYGSLEWMEWMARRLRYNDYHPDVSHFLINRTRTLSRVILFSNYATF